MASVCYACGAPLTGDFKGQSEIYCKGCCDSHGQLRPRADIQRGIAQWFRTWQPDLDESTSLVRADLYMRAMPEWADKG